MLAHLHVKNLALIEEIEVEFGPGLNILTGETGAGKSILLGSMQLILGAKISRNIIRENAPYALVELLFQVENEKAREAPCCHGLLSGGRAGAFVQKDHGRKEYQ